MKKISIHFSRKLHGKEFLLPVILECRYVFREGRWMITPTITTGKKYIANNPIFKNGITELCIQRGLENLNPGK